jgi:putative spermidine/putrescine transport system substrate-binding protein
MRKKSRWLALVGALTLVGVACGGGDEGGGSGGGGGGIVPAKTFDSIGEGEGELHLIAWNGYTEYGATEGYEDYDWVTPFEKESGCEVSDFLKYADTSDEMVTLMRQGGGTAYDGVSASGNASNKLIAGHDVAAIDPSLFPDFANVIAPLDPGNGTNNSHYVVDGHVYGVPYMYGPNFLMYNPDDVNPVPDSWDVTFEPTLDGQPNPYSGSITAYDDPIYIADAAMYLKTHQPDLNITDPYELTQDQFDAAIELLKAQQPMVTKYWSLYTDEIDGFNDGSMVVGTAWPINLTYTKTDAPAAAVIPSEGVTGWADTWMISANAPHPNCMLKWMQWTMKPDIQAEVGIFYGAAGSNTKSCDLIADGLGKGGKDLVDSVEYSYCGNEEFLNSLYLWKTPQANCGDDRGNTCVDYSEWLNSWIEVKG